MRGGEQLAGLIRKVEPVPLRVFLQVSSSDNNLDVSDWWIGNQAMQRSLDFAGYEVNHAWGDGGHNQKHATSVFPDAMRWLWKDWPKLPGNRGHSGDWHARSVLLDEPWELIGEGYGFTESPVATPTGKVFFNDLRHSKTYFIDGDDNVIEWMSDTQRSNGMAFGPDGRRYSLAANAKEVWAFDNEGNKEVVATGIRGNDLVIAVNGNVYITEPVSHTSKRSDRSRIWLVRPNGEKQELDYGLKFANGIALSPDQTQLYVSDYDSRWIYSYMFSPTAPSGTNNVLSGSTKRILKILPEPMAYGSIALEMFG